MLHMYWSKSFFSIFAFFCLLIVTNLDGHGFGAGTLIKTSEDSWCTIEQVCLAFCRNKEHVVSYDLQKQRSILQRIKSVGQGKTNCYYKISFDDNHYNDLICTPTQEFYIFSIQQWVSAYTLQVGDLLLCQNNKVACVTHIECIKQPIKIYTLEIKKTHNFFVGTYAVLTHNMVLPLAFSAGLSIPFGSITCGAIGSFLGPVGVTVGIGLGTIIGLAVKAVFEDRIPSYTIPTYDDTFFDQHIRTINHLNEGIDGISQSFTMVASGAQLEETKNVSFSLEKNKSIKQVSNQSQFYDINPQSPKKPKKDDDEEDKDFTKNQNKNNRPIRTKLTAKQAKIEAKRLGYQKTNYYCNGQPVFKKGNRYISPDADGHNGGVWKMADSVRGLEHKTTRLGTYDINLNRIGD